LALSILLRFRNLPKHPPHAHRRPRRRQDECRIPLDAAAGHRQCEYEGNAGVVVFVTVLKSCSKEMRDRAGRELETLLRAGVGERPVEEELDADVIRREVQERAE